MEYSLTQSFLCRNSGSVVVSTRPIGFWQKSASLANWYVFKIDLKVKRKLQILNVALHRFPPAVDLGEDEATLCAGHQ